MRTLNQNGESLISVMISVALASVITAAAATTASQMYKNAKTMDAQFEAVEVMSELKTVLSFGESCRLNFQGVTLPQVGQKHDIPRVRYPNSDGTALSGDNIIAVNQKLPRGLKVREIALRPKRKIGLDYIVELVVRFEAREAYSPSLVREAELSMRTNVAGVVVSCSTAGGGGPSLTMGSCDAFDATTRYGGTVAGAGNPPTVTYSFNGAPIAIAPYTMGTEAIVQGVCSPYRYLCVNSVWAQVEPEICKDPPASDN